MYTLKNISFIILLFIYHLKLVCYWETQDLDKLAVVILPVINTVGKPLNSYGVSENIDILYDKFPISPEVGSYGYLRLHQLLFNEVVRVKDQLNNEIECEFPCVFYYKFGEKCQIHWTLKKNLLMLKDIPREYLDSIPPSFKDFSAKINLENILTLSWPWHDPITQKTYSAGTRFVRYPAQDNKNYFGIKIYDYKNQKEIISLVPKNISNIKYDYPKKELRKKFVLLAREWVHKKPGFIPYVLGGISYKSRLKDNNFFLVDTKILGKTVQIWSRNDDSLQFTGLDCSALILRIAQIIGIPYFCKNTECIFKTLKMLDKNEQLEEGDLLWMAGHVGIVSDIKNNKFIEAKGYSSGYGKLHEVSLNKAFNKINDYKNLVEIYHNKGSFDRLDSKGEIVEKVPQIIFFKLH